MLTPVLSSVIVSEMLIVNLFMFCPIRQTVNSLKPVNANRIMPGAMHLNVSLGMTYATNPFLGTIWNALTSGNNLTTYVDIV